MNISIPVTGALIANADIDILTITAREIRHAYTFTGSDGAVAAANVVLVIDDKQDGNSAGAGHIRLQANGKKIRVGDALDAKNAITLDIEAIGDYTR